LYALYCRQDKQKANDPLSYSKLFQAHTPICSEPGMVQGIRQQRHLKGRGVSEISFLHGHTLCGKLTVKIYPIYGTAAKCSKRIEKIDSKETKYLYTLISIIFYVHFILLLIMLINLACTVQTFIMSSHLVLYWFQWSILWQDMVRDWYQQLHRYNYCEK